MLPESLNSGSHSRFNPLTGDWVLVSPHRLQRPWQGDVEEDASDQLPAYDPHCYLCPGNVRASGAVNPPYESVLIFDNDFPALQAEVLTGDTLHRGLFTYRSEQGQCKVICFDPAHNRTLAELSQAGIRDVVEAWVQVQTELFRDPIIQYVEIFENKGDMMGCSNPHPHCQVWATSHVPAIPAREDVLQCQYRQRNGSVLLRDYLTLELSEGERIVCLNEDWVALVPFWAVWPFETLLLPRCAARSLSQLDDSQRMSLAVILQDLLQRYDRLFDVKMPYSMGWHGSPKPGRDGDADHWQLHAHYYPPLLRSATVRKFLVGFEMLAQPQRDITPEYAADRLRTAQRDR